MDICFEQSWGRRRQDRPRDGIERQTPLSEPRSRNWASSSSRQRRRRTEPLSLSLYALAFVLSLLLQVCTAQQQLSPPRTNKFKCMPNGCCDQHEWCRFWASIGECQVNQEWMTENCQLACATCRGGSSAPIPPTLPPPPAPNSRERTTATAATAASAVPSTAAAAAAAASSREKTASPPQQSHHNSADSSSVGTAGSCQEIAQKPEHAAEQLAKSGLINPIEDVAGRQTLSLDDITRAVGSGCVPELSAADCSQNLCYHLAYRSLDGVCNNLNRPLLGASFRSYIRHLPAEYDNGFSEPASSMTARRPSPREASRLLLASSQVVPHDQLNSLMMQWGQFMSHDMARTTLQPTANCGTCDPIPSKCVPVSISDKDTNDGFKQKGCLKISRSAPVCGTGHQGKPREQLNENTAFVDGSQIYGSSTRDLLKFRDGRTGMLKLSRFNNLMVLPFDETKCANMATCAASFVAGDIRANLFLGLSSMHILFAREHNRVARALQAMNGGWSGDRLFQETRKIVGAEIQAILYQEFLPRILGSAFDKLLGPYKGYDPQVDPSVSNEFTTSAYRFGHGMILEQYPRIAENGQPIAEGPFLFGDGVFKSQKLLFEGGVDPVVRGLWNTPVKRPHRMTPAITERMFGTTDLGSLNIMRGREHGIPSYNKWRRFCGLEPVSSFEQLKEQILDENVRKALAANYPSPDDLDLYVGGMVEDPVVGGMVGATLACIIGDQFKRTRDGDRFYFENPAVFSAAQLAEIKKISLARIFCDNGDHITEVPAQAFMLPRAGGGLVSCNGGLAQMDLSKWRE